MLIVDIGVISPEVDSSAFCALLGGLCDDPGEYRPDNLVEGAGRVLQ